MLSENEKAARRRFFIANGKAPEDEALDSAKGVGKMLISIFLLAVAASLFYLLA